MNELYIQKLLRLIEKGFINTEDIKDQIYKIEIENRLKKED